MATVRKWDPAELVPGAVPLPPRSAWRDWTPDDLLAAMEAHGLAVDFVDTSAVICAVYRRGELLFDSGVCGTKPAAVRKVASIWLSQSWEVLTNARIDSARRTLERVRRRLDQGGLVNAKGQVLADVREALAHLAPVESAGDGPAQGVNNDGDEIRAGFAKPRGDVEPRSRG